MIAIALQEAYRTRPIRCTGVLEAEGWRLKAYEAAYERDRPRQELLDATKQLAARLPQPPDGEDRYGVGFLCAHDGRGGCYAFVDWWSDENELHHLIYAAPGDSPSDLQPVPPGGLTACVWDLAIMAFERRAWLDSVLANPGGPDLERYLREQLNDDL
jgi:hypothetical protein